jgi:tRNA threonylcarbamoyl adenosine modification protein (Sua5/YciO/YrdC/YwlC family)
VTERYSCADDEERERGIEAAVDAVRDGGIVVFPTDTVYGVGGDAFDPSAVRKLLRAKGRGRDMPPPVLVSAPETLEALAEQVPPQTKALVDAFWPGPLTVVCKQQPSLNWDLGDNRGTVAIRMPDDEVALALLSRTGPMAVSSANMTGLPAATTVAEAEEMLGESVAVYLDGGHLGGGLASTIVDGTAGVPTILRLGAIPVERLREVVPDVQDLV